MNKVQRYTWEDALIAAQVEKRISNGALLLALKLARAINWNPKGKRPSGLYWANEEALKAVGSSRATYFRYRDVLFKEGFLTEQGGNLIPTLPESQVETELSQVETDESQVETEKSQGDNPYSDNTYSENVLSEETYSEEEEVEQGEEQKVLNPSFVKDVETSSLAKNEKKPQNHVKKFLVAQKGARAAEQSQVETILNNCAWSSLALEKYNDPEFTWGGDDINRAHAAVTFSEPQVVRSL